jgi:hypothetical protein
MIRRISLTNVSKTPVKVATRAHLFEIAENTLRKEGWTVERLARSGKASVRQITKGKITKTVSIRTSQDTWIAFPRNSEDTGWVTLSTVDYVVAATVDNRDNPQIAHIHFIEADEMRDRFDRAYKARKEAGYALHQGRGIWISLYEEEGDQPVTLVGAGAGLKHPPIAKVPLNAPPEGEAALPPAPAVGVEEDDNDAPLTIREAKSRLAKSLGVSEDDITITISS